MPVVTFAEIVAADVPGFETDQSLAWTVGGGVDIADISSIGVFCPSDRFNGPRFTIRFKHAETQNVESSNTTAVRKLQAGLTQIWKESQNMDLRVAPIELLSNTSVNS